MPTLNTGEFHAGRRATLVLMLGLFAFGAVSGWSGREMFDVLRSPQQTAQDAQVAHAQPKEAEPAAKSQQPQKEIAPEGVPGVTGEENRPIEPSVAALPEPSKANDAKVHGRKGDADAFMTEQVEELLISPEEFRRLSEEWRRLWFLDQPDPADPLRTHGGII